MKEKEDGERAAHEEVKIFSMFKREEQKKTEGGHLKVEGEIG